MVGENLCMYNLLTDFSWIYGGTSKAGQWGDKLLTIKMNLLPLSENNFHQMDSICLIGAQGKIIRIMGNRAAQTKTHWVFLFQRHFISKPEFSNKLYKNIWLKVLECA